MKNNKHQQGVALYLGLIIMTIILVAALGLSAILVFSCKMTKEMGDSIKSLYAADSGIEQALKDTSPVSAYSGSFGTDYSYNVDVYCSPICPESICSSVCDSLGCGVCDSTNCPNAWDDNCQGSYFCYKSMGNYKGIIRAIEIER